VCAVLCSTQCVDSTCVSIAATQAQVSWAAASAVASPDTLRDQLGVLATYYAQPGFPAAQDAGSTHPSNTSWNVASGPIRRLLASVATTNIGSGQYLVTDTSGSTVSVGYYYQTVDAVANISVLLIPDSSYTAFQARTAFNYYPAYSVVNTALGALSTHIITDVTAPLHLVVVGVNYAATTVSGLAHVFNAACQASCANGGLCNSITSPGCDCVPNGWSGATCSTPVCSTVTCSSAHQVCVAPNTCTCAAGWSGADCSTPMCSSPSCVHGQGTCTAPNTCTCAFGWSGSSCSTPVCTSPTCVSGQGTCTAPDTCTCSAGFGGASCSVNCTEFPRSLLQLPSASLFIRGQYGGSFQVRPSVDLTSIVTGTVAGPDGYGYAPVTSGDRAAFSEAADCAQATDGLPLQTLTGGAQTLSPGRYMGNSDPVFSSPATQRQSLVLSGKGLYTFYYPHPGYVEFAAPFSVSLRDGADANDVFWFASTLVVGSGVCLPGTLFSWYETQLKQNAWSHRVYTWFIDVEATPTFVNVRGMPAERNLDTVDPLE
jgi:hypothetical protein